MNDPSPLIAFYPQIRWVHIAAVCTSGAIFFVRGLMVQLGHKKWAMSASARYLSYGVDTLLLTAALMLLTILPQGMFANGWLTTKLFLVVAYVLLGTLALRRGRTRAIRGACYVAALTVFVWIVGIALAHHPLGWLLPLLHA